MKKNEYYVTFRTERYDVGFYTYSTNAAKAVANAQKEYYRQRQQYDTGSIVEVVAIEKYVNHGHDVRELKVPSKKTIRKAHG